MARSMRRRADSRSGRPHDHLGDEVVVELRDRVAGLVAGVEADAGPRGGVERRERARGRREAPAAGVLRVDPDLDGVTVAADVLLREVERSRPTRCGSARRRDRARSPAPSRGAPPAGGCSSRGSRTRRPGTGTRPSRRCSSRRPRETFTAATPMAWRTWSGKSGAGLSSTSFWCRRWAEQSRSPSHSVLPCWSARTCISTWRGQVEIPLQVDLGAPEVRLGLAGRRLHGLGRFLRRRDDLHAAPAARRRRP